MVLEQKTKLEPVMFVAACFLREAHFTSSALGDQLGLLSVVVVVVVVASILSNLH